MNLPRGERRFGFGLSRRFFFGSSLVRKYAPRSIRKTATRITMNALRWEVSPGWVLVVFEGNVVEVDVLVEVVVGVGLGR